MADLSITVAVATGTQYQVGGSGNVFTFDGSQPASYTLPWVKGGTVRLEQSGSTNDGHPLIFSTSNSTTLGTMQAGIISSGVTYYLDGSSNQSDYTNTTTFNAATTRYIEIAPASETDFYFACWVHGIGMGGIVDLTQNTWGALSWGQNQYGSQNHVDVFPTGLSITGSLGEPASYAEQGWGRATWGSEIWGDSYDPVLALTGFSITASLGTLPYAQSEEGWGRDEWGTGNWGENTTTVILDGLEMTGEMGPDSWGKGTWGDNSWGGQPFALTTMSAMAVGVTGLEATGSLGTPQINYDFKVTLTDSLLGTLSRGSLSINSGADHTQGLGGIAMTGSLGTPNVEVITFPTGLSATMSLGTPTISEAQLVDLTGIAATGSLGSLTVADMAIGLSGIAITGSVGSMTVTDMQIGLSGFEMTSALGSGGVSPLHYKDVDITGYTAYTDIEHSA